MWHTGGVVIHHLNYATATILLLAAAGAHGYEYRMRWVERVGSVDLVIGEGHTQFDASDLAPHRIRLQFGVFYDGAAPAPAGGFIGWGDGSISVSGDPDNSRERRTPGRLGPFTFYAGANQNGNPPSGGPGSGDEPGTDYQGWTQISAGIENPTPYWGFDEDGNPLPQPPAPIRGLNTFISVYEITIDPNQGALDYVIDVGGLVVAASEWRVVGIAVPPDPATQTPGLVMYAPVPTDPVAITGSLNVRTIPAPAGALTLLASELWIVRRRR